MPTVPSRRLRASSAAFVLAAALLGSGLTLPPTYASSSVTTGVETGEDPINVTQNPEDKDVDSGTAVTFSAAATGTPTPTIQWQRSVDGGDTFDDVTGETGGTYGFTVTTDDDGLVVRAEFTSGTEVVPSDNAYVTVAPVAPVVTQGPESRTVEAGTDATFTVAGTGDPAPSVQWQEKLPEENDGEWYDVDSATETTYVVEEPTLEKDGAQYRAVLTNDAGEVTTAAATLTVTGKLPGSPTGITGKATGQGQLTISWTAPTDVGEPGPITGYEVGYSGGQFGSGISVAADQRSAFLNDIPTGRYKISVQAVNAAGTSPYVVSATSIQVINSSPSVRFSNYLLTAGQRLRIAGISKPGSTVRIERALPGRGFMALKSVKATKTGDYGYTSVVTRTASYRARTIGGTVSGAEKIEVANAVSMGVRRLAVRKYKLAGTVSPAAARQAVGIYARTSKGFTKIGSDRTDSRGRWTFTHKFSSKKTYTLRAVSARTTLNVPGEVIRRVAVH